MIKRTLRAELRQAGAQPSEIDGLIAVSAQLRQLRPTTVADQPQSWWQRCHIIPIGAASLLSLLIGGIIVAYAQTSLPGSWLYPAKRASEQVAVVIDPNYRSSLMMRRSQEVAALVQQHASQRLVLATLADYRSEAAAYESARSVNYAAFEYCKSNLQQAANVAPNPERTAITTTVASLQT